MSAFFANRRSQSEVDSPEARPALQPSRAVGFDSIVGANTSITGDFRSSGNVRMDGAFQGTLEISGNILVGESAEIEAHIHARNISIAGVVRGDVQGEKVQLLRTGRIWGDINAATLTTEEGAFIDGKITMAGHAATRSSDDEADTGDDSAEPVAPADEPSPDEPREDRAAPPQG